ncbi:MAG: sulfotransferase [Candidatus Omnitrophota bacterium]
MNMKPDIDSTSPIIVVGMHRSGTTLICEILEQCGVFMGKDQTANRESVFFQQINRDILDMMGVSWRCLEFLPSAADLTTHFEWMRRKIHKKLEDGFLSDHLGTERLSLFDANFVWGWKDPRTSLLLPVWYDVFPRARVVHVLRDGRKAARSLLFREMKRENNPAFFSREEMARRYLANIELWKDYVIRVQESIDRFDVRHTVRYEQLMENPLQEIASLLEALSIEKVDPLTREQLAARVDPRRWEKKTDMDFSWLDALPFDRTFLEDLGFTR